MKKRTLGLAMCGSFCTFSRVLDAFETLDQELYELVPIMSQASFETDSRFGPAAQFRARLDTLCRAVRPEKASGRARHHAVHRQHACKAGRRHRRRSGHAGGKGTFAERASRDRRRVDQRRSGRKRGKSRHAFEPTRILFCPLRTGQRVQKAALPRRGFHKAAADRRIRAARRTGSADAVRDACWIGSCRPLRSVQPAAVFVGAEAGELFEGAGKMTAVGIADEVDDIADLEAGVCQQLLGLFDADGIEQVVIALLFYCIFRIRVRGSINFPNRQCCQFKAVNLMQNSLKFKLARQDAPNHRKSSANSYALVPA